MAVSVGSVRSNEPGSRKCLPRALCSCFQAGKLYADGDTARDTLGTCTCNGGQWECRESPRRPQCALRGSGHVETFDSAEFVFHSEGSFLLAATDNWSLLVSMGPCESALPCPTGLTLESSQVVLEIGSDGRVFMGDRSLPLPYHSDVLTLYVQSGGSLQLLSATLGLQVQVQFQAGMHVYVTVQGAMQGQLKGLCGNLNRVQADDFVGPQGSVEATGQLLATAWSTSSTSTTSTTTAVTVPLICRSGGEGPMSPTLMTSPSLRHPH
ncbi:mucin-2-like [Lampetra fluviatilis]